MSGAWAKGTSAAVAAPPPPPSTLQQQATSGGRGPKRGNTSGGGGRNSHNSNSRGGRGGGRGRGRHNNNNNNSNNHSNNNHGGRGGGGRGGRNAHNNRKQNENGGRHGGRGDGKRTRISMKEVQLLNPGDGNTPQQKAVQRIPGAVFMRLRLNYIDPPENFSPHKDCHWTADNRVEELEALSMRAIELGDVSKRGNKPSPHETAPPLEECKPLEVNDETRWKRKAEKDGTEADSDEETMAKALLILNKMSWTTLEKLTVQFMEITNLEENEKIRHTCIEQLIHKAQREHHFGPMYAQLCADISKKVKIFKKDFLSQCQHEFDTDVAHKIENATKGMTDPEEVEYHTGLIRKAYIGHVKFLGELYVRDVVKLSPMLYCLDELLKEDDNDENLECFASMMTTMGHKLDDHAKVNNKPFDWSRVEAIKSNGKLSTRVKFLLIDLLELKDRGWVKRRQEETAKHVAEIHKEVAEEEAAAAAKNIRRVSTPSMRRSQSLASTPTVDADGFVEITPKTMKRISSKGSSLSEIPNLPPMPQKNPHMRRSQSQPTSFTVSPSPVKKNVVSPEKPPELSPKELANKAKTAYKEFLVGGDLDDLQLSLRELIREEAEGGNDRAAKVAESGILLVLEMKATDVIKMVTVLLKCHSESIFTRDVFAEALKDPLEFLSDIEIDAPLAGKHLAKMVAELVAAGAVDFSMLTKAPGYFLSDGKPAQFACRVLQAKGGDPSAEDLAIVEELLQGSSEKSTYASAQEVLAKTS